MPGNIAYQRKKRQEEQTEAGTAAQSIPQAAMADASAWTRDLSSDEQEEDEDEEIDNSDADSLLTDSSSVAEFDLDATAATLMQEAKEAEMPQAMENFFDLIIWGVPFTSLFVLFDIMIQQQYAMHPTILQEIGRMLGTVPFLLGIIWITTIRPVFSRPRLQAILFLASTVCGCSFIYVFNESLWQDVMRRSAPLGTLWIYCIVKLDLLPCVVSLALVGGFIWWQDLPIMEHRLKL